MSAQPSQAPGLLDRIELSRAEADRWVWVIEPSGRRLHGAAAVGRVLNEMGGGWRTLGYMARLPGARMAYALVARGRGLLSRVVADPPPYG